MMTTRDRVLDIYAGLVAAYEGVEIKGAKSNYTAVNGNMFSFVDPDGGLCIRLSEVGKAAFNEENGQGDVVQYGAVMRGYVAVPEGMLGDRAAVRALFAEAVNHARALKRKPTKKARRGS